MVTGLTCAAAAAVITLFCFAIASMVLDLWVWAKATKPPSERAATRIEEPAPDPIFAELKTYYYDVSGIPRAKTDNSAFWGKVFEQEDIHGADYMKYLYPKTYSDGDAVSIYAGNGITGRCGGMVSITSDVSTNNGGPITLTGGAGGSTSACVGRWSYASG